MKTGRHLLQIIFVFVVIAAAGLFGWGFILGIGGDVGKPVAPDGMTMRDELEQNRERERILVIGDSLAKGTGDATGMGIGRNLEQLFEEEGRNVEWYLNLGVDGSRTRDVIERLESPGTRRILGRASIIILSIGANDVFYESGRGGTLTGVDPEEILDRVEEVIDLLREENDDALLFVIGLYSPFGQTAESAKVREAVAEWNSELSRRIADDQRVVVVPTADLFSLQDRLSADRFHPGAEAYELIARRIAQALI